MEFPIIPSPAPAAFCKPPPLTRLLWWGIAFILLIAVVEKWGFYPGFNLKFYEVVFVIWSPIAIVWVAMEPARRSLPRPLLIVVVLKLFYLGLVFASGFALLTNSNDVDGIPFFLKGALQIGVRTGLFVLLVLVLSNFTASQRQRLVGVHVAAVSLSAFYGLLQGAAILWRAIDVDQIVSEVLEPLTGSAGASLARYAYGPFYRLNGLAGDPNLHASYAITAVPILFALFLRRPHWLMAVLLGCHACMLTLTMSLSGIVGLTVSMLLVACFHGFSLKIRHFVYGVLLVLCAFAAFVHYQESILHLVEVRTDPTGTATQHAAIAGEALQIYRQHPFGVGYNNFSIAWRDSTDMYSDRAMNPHNSYLAILVESGPLALLCELTTYGFIVGYSLHRGTPFARAFAASVAGLCVAALAYQTFEMFFAQLFILLGFTCVASGDKVWFGSPRQAKA